MPMVPFVEKFPVLGVRETRTAAVTGRRDLPDGEYGFFECYCNEPGCDCRRVMILVLRPETGWSKTWASFSYGWESPEFYRKWVPLMKPAELEGPFLDPLNPQTALSGPLLELFRFLLESPEYADRLRRHYRMFRDAVEAGHGAAAKAAREVRRRRPERRRKRRR